jgi:hypothetical protein
LGGLRAVARQQHPAFGESDPTIKIDEVVSILTSGIARGECYENGQFFSRIKICRRCQYGDGALRHSVATLPGE